MESINARTRGKWRIVGTAVAITASVLVGFGFSASPASAVPDVCAGNDSGKIDVTGDVQSVTVSAPEGKLISGYCVKTGNTSSGGGTEFVVVDPPQETVTIVHSSGKDISHYSLVFVDGVPNT